MSAIAMEAVCCTYFCYVGIGVIAILGSPTPIACHHQVLSHDVH